MARLVSCTPEGLNRLCVYFGRSVPVSLDKTNETVADTITEDVYVVVSRVDAIGRFEGCVAHTTAKELAKMDPMVKRGTKKTHVKWTTEIDSGKVLTLEFSLDEKSMEVLESCKAVDPVTVMKGAKTLAKFFRDTGIVKDQPYCAYAASTYPEDESFFEFDEDYLKETMIFYIFCMRLARSIYSSKENSDIDTATLVVALSGLTQVNYTSDSKSDLPSMPMMYRKKEKGELKTLIGDCEDITGYVVNFVCRCHQVAERIVAVKESGNAVDWIRRMCACSENEAKHVDNTLAVIRQYVPLHMVISSEEEMHSTVALCSHQMIHMIFGKHAFKAAPVHMLTEIEEDGKKGVKFDVDNEISDKIAELAPFVFVDATAFQPPTMVSEGMDMVDSTRFNIFDSRGNNEYCEKAMVVALFGANASRTFGDSGVSLTALSRTVVPKDYASNTIPIFSEKGSDPLEVYPYVLPTYPSCPLYVSLKSDFPDGFGTGMIKLSYKNEKEHDGVMVYRAGCKYIHVYPVRKTKKSKSAKERREMSGRYNKRG